MSDIKNDPDFPYQVVAEGARVLAKFSTLEGANRAKNTVFPRAVVRNTATKIPDDARIIAWKPDNYPRRPLMYAEYQGLISSDKGKLWRMSTELSDVGQDMLESIIGDKPINVLMTQEAYVL